jgi:hypothetical protein
MYRESFESNIWLNKSLDTENSFSEKLKSNIVTYNNNLGILSSSNLPEENYLMAMKIVTFIKEECLKLSLTGNRHFRMYTDINFSIKKVDISKDCYFSFLNFSIFKKNTIGYFLKRELKRLGFKHISIGYLSQISLSW